MATADGSPIGPPGVYRVGDNNPLTKHQPKQAPKAKGYRTPSPWDYNTQAAVKMKYSTRTHAFGGNLCKMDRRKGGPQELAHTQRKQPGPDVYSSNAAEGKLRCRPRSPVVKFGSANRDDLRSQYISKRDTEGHNANIHAARNVPGPGTYNIVEHEHIKRRAPQYSMRPKLRSTDPRPASSPNVGPGSYDASSSIGVQKVSTRSSSARAVMGTSTRMQERHVCTPGVVPTTRLSTPSPQEYKTREALGKQAVSRARTSAAYTFGGSQTKPLTPAGRRPKGRPPGPGSYGWESSMGLQSNARFKSSGGFKFGTATRPDPNAGLVG